VERWRALPLEEHVKYENLAKEMDNKRKRGSGRIGGAPVTGIESFMNRSESSKPEAKKIQKKTIQKGGGPGHMFRETKTKCFSNM